MLKLPVADPLRDRAHKVESLVAEGDHVLASLSNGETLAFPRNVANHLRVGDLVAQSAPAEGGTPDTLILKPNRREGELLHIEIGYAAKPKWDKRDRGLICAEVPQKSFDLNTLHLSTEAVRDYFYAAHRGRNWEEQPSLYDLLKVDPNATPGDLRLAYKVRSLEARLANSPSSACAAITRAFNLLAHPELRQVYAELRRKPGTPPLFPYAGFGAILVGGERSRDGGTFFARAIHSFRPRLQRRTLAVRLRFLNFEHDRAVYRDSKKRLELDLDPVNLPVGWNPTWNTWKHLLPTQLTVEADFVQTGKYVKKGTGWELSGYERALPSSLQVVFLTDDWEHQIESAWLTHHRFGQCALALSHIRRWIDKEPVEEAQIRDVLAKLRVPPDFEIERIAWQPDYNPFFFEELKKRCRRFYLFRREFIFELERAVAVEVPQAGHATYLYMRMDMGEFVKIYAQCSRIEIRHNQGNAAERLHFIGRVAHTRDPGQWLRELRVKLGEPAGSVQAIS